VASPFEVDEITEIITGGAEGADTLANDWAKAHGIDRAIFPANWKGKGRAAGYKRNQKMGWYASLFMNEVSIGRPDLKGGCIAIWKNKSVGTGHMIDIAREAGLEVFIYPVEEVQESAEQPV